MSSDKIFLTQTEYYNYVDCSDLSHPPKNTETQETIKIPHTDTKKSIHETDESVTGDLYIILKMLKKSIEKIKEYQNELIEERKKSMALEKLLEEKQKRIIELENK
jgi:hypothetical protein